MCVSVGWEDKKTPSAGPLDERLHLSIPEFLDFNPGAGRDEKKRRNSRRGIETKRERERWGSRIPFMSNQMREG